MTTLETTSPPGVRLRIAHFALWVLCAGVLMAGTQWLSAHGFDQLTKLGQTVTLFNLLTHALAMTGALVLVHQLYHQKLQLENLQPGHWMAFYLSVGVAFNVISYPLIFYTVSQENPNELASMILWTAAHGYRLVELILCLVAALALATTRFWGWVFLLLGGTVLFSLLTSLVGLTGVLKYQYFEGLTYFRQFLNLIVVGLVIVALVKDHSHRMRRDWIHWSCVAVFIVTTLGAFYWHTLSGRSIEMLLRP